jgi:signal peptidase II
MSSNSRMGNSGLLPQSGARPAIKNNISRILLIILVISINIGCDQSTKYLAKKHLQGIDTVNVFDDYFVLHYTENRGAFLSLFSALPDTLRILLLLILPAIALVLMTCYVIYNQNLPRRYQISLSCLLGGGISNVMIDRMFNNGHVIDFMNIGIGSIRSGIFNFADLSIVFGSCALLLFAYTGKTRDAA